jgi:hypothetical protein
MASQDGILKLRGTVAGLVFMKNGSVRRKPGSNKAHFTTAPSMVRVRENANEFGAASTAGKLLRVALGGAIQGIKYRKLVPRLTREMSKAIKRDAIHGCGQRQVLKAHAAALLPGFELNEEAPLGSTLRVPYSVARAGAVIRVDIPSINPSRDLLVPLGATHYELVAAAAAIDFEAGSYDTAQPGAGVGITPLNGETVADAGVVLTLAAAPGPTAVTVVTLGVNYYQQVSGELYELNNKSSNSLAIVFND